MKRQLTLTAVAVLTAMASVAAPLTPEQALGRLKSGSPAKARTINASQYKLVHTEATPEGQPAAYVFTKETGNGYTVLSASDLCQPVLGYSDSGKFDYNNMPDAMKWWLGKYAEEVAYAENMPASQRNIPARINNPVGVIEPLCKTRWDQGSPYNAQCPVIGGSPAPTGCVATSMAQAMNYHKYPEVGTGSKTYSWNGRKLSIDFSAQKFDWDNMINYYAGGSYTQAQGDAVAYLMKACGYSVEMNYTAAASGATSNKIVRALIDNFGYDKGAYYASRDSYSYDEWMKLCHENLMNYGPIIYNGVDPLAGGHSFIIDGYSGDGYFHVNWGWGGMSDGYFLLDALTPVSQGAGGAEGGFNYSQDAVIGMCKPREGSVEQPLALTQMGYVEAKLNGIRIEFSTTGGRYKGWYNMNSVPMSIYLGAIIEPTEGGEKIIRQISIAGSTAAFNLNPSTGIGATGRIAMSATGLPDGKYKVTIASRTGDSAEGDYIPVICPYGYPNYVMLDVKDGKVSVENVQPNTLKFESVELTAPLYNGRNTRLKAHIVNDSDLQLTAVVTPALLQDGNDIYQAETVAISVDPNSSIDYEWICSFHLMNPNFTFTSPQTFQLRLYNEETNRVYGNFGDVEMTSTASGFILTVDKFDIEGATPGTVEAGGQSFNNVYSVANPNDFTVNFDYSVTRGYFDTQVVMGIYTREGATYVPVTDYVFEDQPMAGTGAHESNQIKVSFPENDPEKVYYLRALYSRSGNLVYLGQILFHSAMSAVDEIETDDNTAPAEYYNLQGMRISEPLKGQIVIMKKGGKTVKVMK